MFSELLQLSLSANVVLFGLFPVIIIGLGVAYGVKQWRDHQRQRKADRQRRDAGTSPPPP
jgi:uncharacterized protein HemY